jgi:hypothetical protein
MNFLLACEKEVKVLSEPEIEKNAENIKLEPRENRARDMNFERENLESSIKNEEAVPAELPIVGRMTGTIEQLERAMQDSLYAMSTEVKECIQNCVDCFKACTETASRCLKMGGKHAEIEYVNLIFDCARICNLNADFMLRNSLYYPQTCKITADVCEDCADACDRFEDDFMKQCAIVCRRCSDSCRAMAK